MATFLCFVEPSLTVDNLAGVMKRLKLSGNKESREVWKKILEWKYHNPGSYLDDICNAKYTSDEETRILADVYVNSRPKSSWEHIVQILYYEGELAAAKQAKSFLQLNGG